MGDGSRAGMQKAAPDGKPPAGPGGLQSGSAEIN